ncbi:hypothetical protein HDU86_004862 [Geranomyces michiganensis]|nr:hypothetical protein HDU86_004862 [Geranomyces michiganensis]
MILNVASFLGAAVGFAGLAAAAPLRFAPRDGASCPALPQFAVKYAPILYLHSAEDYFMTDPLAMLPHVVPKDDSGNVLPGPTPLTSANLGAYSRPGSNVWLTSLDDPEKNPAWQHGTAPVGGKSDGPITIVVTPPKGNDGVIDVFYMLYYAFNHGPKVLGRVYGNHVGDWEYVSVRFSSSGEPLAMYFSEHDTGTALQWSAVQKTGDRPIVYVARGSHANYPNNGNDGKHPYKLPFGILSDATSSVTTGGKLVDPAMNYRTYCYDGTKFSAGADTQLKDVGWLDYTGNWGDARYPKSDKRQYELFGQYLFADYVGGPSGVVRKNLMRLDLCENSSGCSLSTKNIVEVKSFSHV